MEAVRLVTTRDGGVRFTVHARPRAPTSHLAAVRGGALVVKLAAPPVDGAANAELVATLARALSLSQRHVRLVRGEGSREKLVEVRGLTAVDVAARLIAAMPAG
jgi:hypothetical protein